MYFQINIGKTIAHVPVQLRSRIYFFISFFLGTSALWSTDSKTQPTRVHLRSGFPSSAVAVVRARGLRHGQDLGEGGGGGQLDEDDRAVGSGRAGGVRVVQAEPGVDRSFIVPLLHIALTQ